MARTQDPRPHAGVMDITPYKGGAADAPGVDNVIRLASIESALGPSPKAIDAYKAAASALHRYPDGEARLLREAIGRRHGLDPAQIVCGSGSDELISLLITAYAGPGEEVLYTQHGFLMYRISAMAAGATPDCRAGNGFARRRRYVVGACHLADAHCLHRQPQQSHGHLPHNRRVAALARWIAHGRHLGN